MSVHTSARPTTVPKVGGVLPSFTRATTAMRVNSAGLLELVDAGVPRLTYDPVTLACLGYLAEGARTNLLLRSEEFNNASWAKGNTTISANATTSPDGTQTADKVIRNADTSQHRVSFDDQGSYTPGTYTLSVFAKAAELNYIGLTLYDGVDYRARVTFNLTTGQAEVVSNGSAGSEQLPNGWWRLWVTGTTTQDLADANDASGFWPHSAAVLASSASTGDGTSGVYVWGAQLEVGAFPSSYIPTTTAAVTRNADVLTYPTSGLILDAAGTLYAEAQLLGIGSANAGIVGFAVQGALYLNGSATALAANDGTNGVVKTVASRVTAMRKQAVSWNTSEGLAITGDGLTPQTNSYDGAWVGSNLSIGLFGGSNQLYGIIARVKYWAQRLTNAQLQAITNGEDIGIEPDFDVNFASEDLAEQTGSLDYARIGYHNPVRDLTVVASSEEEDFPADAAQRPDTYESWKPTTMPATWAIDFGAAVAIDYVGIAAHELGTKGCTVKVQYSYDNSAWYDGSDEATPADDSPMLLLFSPESARYWRVYLSQAASPTDAPEVGVIYMGRILTMQRSIYGGHSPITLSRETVLHQSLSRGGNFLGQGFRRSGLVSQASFRHLKAAWYRENFDPFVLAARRYPYFFAWRPGTWPDELAYAWTDEDIRPANMGIRDFMAVSWPMRGYVSA